MPRRKGKQRAAIQTKVIKRKSSEEDKMQNQIPHREDHGQDDADKDNIVSLPSTSDISNPSLETDSPG